VEHDHGSTAIAGAAFYDGDGFPEPYRGSLFVGNVMTSRVIATRSSGAVRVWRHMKNKTFSRATILGFGRWTCRLDRTARCTSPTSTIASLATTKSGSTTPDAIGAGTHLASRVHRSPEWVVA